MPKGIMGDFEFKEFEVLKNDTRGHRCMFNLRVLKENNKSWLDSYNVRNVALIISHITYRAS